MKPKFLDPFFIQILRYLIYFYFILAFIAISNCQRNHNNRRLAVMCYKISHHLICESSVMLSTIIFILRFYRFSSNNWNSSIAKSRKKQGRKVTTHRTCRCKDISRTVKKRTFRRSGWRKKSARGWSAGMGRQRDDPMALGDIQAEGVLPTAVSQQRSSNRFPFPWEMQHADGNARPCWIESRNGNW